mmetsp:Transcript_34508/g.48063  ORF Transcript_34508/g.48063 Transcript_34508/m.48063 type:complete len:81 (-) Transcript_34508:537-779(-)
MHAAPTIEHRSNTISGGTEKSPFARRFSSNMMANVTMPNNTKHRVKPSLAAVLLLNAEKMVDSFTKKNKQIPYHLNMTIL